MVTQDVCVRVQGGCGVVPMSRVCLQQSVRLCVGYTERETVCRQGYSVVSALSASTACMEGSVAWGVTHALTETATRTRAIEPEGGQQLGEKGPVCVQGWCGSVGGSVCLCVWDTEWDTVYRFKRNGKKMK